MADILRAMLAQLDCALGDLDGNAERVSAAWAQAAASGEDLVVFPEMAISGCATQDLVQKPAFVAACAARVQELAEKHAAGPAALIGGPLVVDGALYNGAWLLEGGGVRSVFRKWDLPSYGVFDEKRLFTPGPEAGPVSIGGVRVGVAIGEDAWTPHFIETLAESGAEILISPSASPYERGKYEIDRIPRMVARVVESGAPLAYLNTVGVQDVLAFDGGSFALDQGGDLAAQAPFFEESLLRVVFTREGGAWRCRAGAGSEQRAVPPAPLESDYQAMAVAVKGFAAKNGFDRAMIGFTGEASGALAAAIAADALGPERTTIVAAQGEGGERAAAASLADRLGCRLESLPAALAAGEASERLAARLLGARRAALAEKAGALLLAAGDKTDFALGTARQEADVFAGYAPLKDLYRTRVLDLCRWRGKHHAPWMKGPEGVVLAEQAESGGGDDAILELLVEGEASLAEIAAEGYDAAEARRLENLLAAAEPARRRSAPGPKLGPRAFGPDRRYPITNRWRDRG